MSKQNPNSKLQKLLSGDEEDPIKRLPRRAGGGGETSPKASAPQVGWAPRYKFLPTLWTVASAISLGLNVILVIVLIFTLYFLGDISTTANDQFSGILGGLYNNFVKMDEAHIKTTIPIRQEIPVQFTLNVSGNTVVVLTEDVPITNALVTVQTGGLNIVNAQANIVLPAGTPLPVNIQGLVVPVDQRIPIAFDVGVDIPLNQTDLHTPFVGLQAVVKPFYCLVEINAVNSLGQQICSPLNETLQQLQQPQPTQPETEPITP